MWFFGKTRSSLQGIDSAEKVVLKGRVASPNELTSPMAGGRAAIFEVVVGVRYMRSHPLSTNNFNKEEIEVFDRLGSQVFGDFLLIEAPGGLLAVPKGAKLEFPAVEALAVLPVTGSLPGRLSEVESHPAASKGMLSYQELSLSQGDPVRFEGWVAPLRSVQAYREAACTEAVLAQKGVTHLADLERGPASVRDLSTDGEEFRRSGAMKLVAWFLNGRR